MITGLFCAGDLPGKLPEPGAHINIDEISFGRDE